MCLFPNLSQAQQRGRAFLFPDLARPWSLLLSLFALFTLSTKEPCRFAG